MIWTHIRANGGMGMVEQWLLRVGTAPACSLRRDPEAESWTASLLNVSGITCAVLHVHGASLEQAQRDCEAELRHMGWELGQEAAE